MGVEGNDHAITTRRIIHVKVVVWITARDVPRVTFQSTSCVRSIVERLFRKTHRSGALIGSTRVTGYGTSDRETRKITQPSTGSLSSN